MKGKCHYRSKEISFELYDTPLCSTKVTDKNLPENNALQRKGVAH